MSTFGIQTFDASGNLIFDTSTAQGGVAIDFRIYGPTESATLTYPDYAGYTVWIIHFWPNQGTVTLDTALGYARITVAAGGPGPRQFIVMAK